MDGACYFEPDMSLIRSKQRVADHGVVFTPAGMVEVMLDLVKSETERIDSCHREPAAPAPTSLWSEGEEK